MCLVLFDLCILSCIFVKTFLFVHLFIHLFIHRFVAGARFLFVWFLFVWFLFIRILHIFLLHRNSPVLIRMVRVCCAQVSCSERCSRLRAFTPLGQGIRQCRNRWQEQFGIALWHCIRGLLTGPCVCRIFLLVLLPCVRAVLLFILVRPFFSRSLCSRYPAGALFLLSCRRRLWLARDGVFKRHPFRGVVNGASVCRGELLGVKHLGFCADFVMI
mmetsp:Transcript_10693/g.32732  ORF Transcript_10693/g.32732 Transcript_10693/m.32732 type:complete len:215 (-) Transcript_10693:884-1528(-)